MHHALLLPQEAHGDQHQLVGGVVGELDRRGEARLEAGVAREQRAHVAGVAREDDDEVVAVVLGELCRVRGVRVRVRV